MQLVEPRSKVQTNIDGKEFRIANTSFMFSTLIKKLYSDPISAVLRELSANAVDAHIEAGHTKQFEVSLPSFMDQTFWIRDYGPGMSKDKIDNIYTEVGTSDKRDTNTQAGCFGLGSKTPFSLTDKFTVESWHNGRYYLYSMYMNSNSIPSYSLLQEKDSNEPSGLKITIKVSDYSTWQRTASFIYKYFTIQPKFVGASVNIEKPTYILEGKNWGVFGTRYSGGHITAIMGQIPYSINKEAMRSKLTNLSLSRLLDYGIDLYFNLGDLSITPSRESLELNNRTVLNLTAKLQDINDSLEDEVKKQLNVCKNLWEARLLINKLSKNDLFRGVNFEYQNQKIDTYIDCSNKFDLKGVDRSAYSISGIQVYDDVKIYENDLKIGAVSRIKEVHQTNGYTNSNYLITFADAKEKKEFCELCGFDESYILKASDLPKPNPKSRSVTYKVSVLNTYNSWQEEKVDPKIGGIYVPTYRYDTLFNKKKIHNYEVTELLKYYSSYNKITSPKLIGIKKAYVDTFIKNGTWLNLFEEIIKIIKIEEAQKFDYYTNIPYIHPTNISLITSSKIGQAYNNINNCKKSGEKIHELKRLANILDINFDFKGKNLTDEFYKITQNYPLIDLGNNSSGFSQHFQKYIELVDKGIF